MPHQELRTSFAETHPLPSSFQIGRTHIHQGLSAVKRSTTCSQATNSRNGESRSYLRAAVVGLGICTASAAAR